MSRFSWSRNRPSGRMMTPESHTLRRGSESYAIVQKGARGFFAYSIGACPVFFNTTKEPGSLADVKTDALARVRAALTTEGQQ